MKDKQELKEIIKRIANPESPVGMDAVYVHAVIIDKLHQIEQRLDRLEGLQETSTSVPDPK